MNNVFQQTLVERVNAIFMNETTIMTMINAINFHFKTTCAMCDGSGHTSTRCSTRRKLYRLLVRVGRRREARVLDKALKKRKWLVASKS